MSKKSIVIFLPVVEWSLRIKDMDLSQMDDKDIQQIIDDLIETDDKRFLEALKQFKATGVSVKANGDLR